MNDLTNPWQERHQPDIWKNAKKKPEKLHKMKSIPNFEAGIGILG